MVLDSLGEEKRQEILHCPPHEGIGREEAADVRKLGFIPRASATCVVTYLRYVVLQVNTATITYPADATAAKAWNFACH